MTVYLAFTGFVLLALGAACWVANSPDFPPDDSRRFVDANLKKTRYTHSFRSKRYSIIHTARASESAPWQVRSEPSAIDTDDGNHASAKAGPDSKAMAERRVHCRGTSSLGFQRTRDSRNN